MEDIDNVHSQMLEIIEDKKKLNKFQLELKWKDFLKKYPMIFITLQNESDIDLDMLKTLVIKIKEINTGNKTKDEAEKEFGETLADKYIYTKFEKPSEADLSKAYETALQKRKDFNVENNLS